MKKNKFVCLFVCLCQGQKNIFLCFSIFALDVEKTWSWLGSKVKKTLFPSGFKGQKNIFYDFLLSRLISRKNMVLVEIESSKKHRFPSGFKGQKNIFFVYLISHWISKKLGLG